ncbi:MAG: hypothetical protein D3913_04125 [Candidatus Electrothrix sp. LOE1_4_5]|nr:hypothetical protein [Candidatus Electrothrix gigas]
MKQHNIAWFIGILCVFFPAFAFAQTETGASTAGLHNVGEVLITILVLSVVFEVAMTPIFNWRVFLKYGEGKGWKTPIVIGTALIVFWSYNIDIISNLLVSLGQKAELDFGGQLLTALLIAGGSDGVFRIFTKLNIRNPAERKEKAEQARAEAGKKETELQGGTSD